ncbi:hypothetical protein [uncultured Mediterranean phage uvDeep-CGR2-KM18-C74]|nr:hypothetical protein [uncultured Mediterranean phage uvDeep-CGR2-KM18-C74]
MSDKIPICPDPQGHKVVYEGTNGIYKMAESRGECVRIGCDYQRKDSNHVFERTRMRKTSSGKEQLVTDMTVSKNGTPYRH